MPYDNLADLPRAAQKLPKQGQKIYQAAFNSAWESYNKDESKAHATAWGAVKAKYERDAEGNWREKMRKSLCLVVPLEKTNPGEDNSVQKYGEEADQYLQTNSEHDHAAMVEAELDSCLLVIQDLLEKIQTLEGGGDLQKAWSEEARAAAAEARGKSTSRRNESQMHTGLKHSEMNKTGFIKTQNMTGDRLARARDYNNARSAMVKSRSVAVKALGSGENHKEALQNYQKAVQRVSLTGGYFRISK